MSNVNDIVLNISINVAGCAEYSMNMPAGKAAKMLGTFFDDDYSFTAEDLYKVASEEHGRYMKVGCIYLVFVSFP